MALRDFLPAFIRDRFPAPAEAMPPRRRTLDGGSIPGLMPGSGSGGFKAAKLNRLTEDFVARSRSADQDLFGDNIRLRSRARTLAIDNPYCRKFLAMCAQNVVGPKGIRMYARITGTNGKPTAETIKINQRIEKEWRRWGRKSRAGKASPSADGKFSWIGLQHMFVKNIAREGENLIKVVYGKQFNETGFALQCLDNDQLDDTMIVSGADGSSIRMGVEVDKFRRPLFYHLWTQHPTDIFSGGQRVRTPVPASQIIHSAVWERPGQTRGYTWLTAAILPLNMHQGWDEATLVAARTSAAKFFSIESDYPDGIDFGDEDDEGDDRNTDGTQVATANSGEGWTLEPGQKLNYIDPRFPMNSHKEFAQSTLRSVATGLLVSYPSLANDLEGVNFSSIRAGLLDERDSWRVIQRWIIEDLYQPVFDMWLEVALLTTLKDITLTPEQREQILWRPRGWPWVDPQKDANTAVLKIGNLLSTRGKELAEEGEDFEEMLEEAKREQDLIDASGLKIGTDLTADQAGKGVAAGAEGDVTAEGGAGQQNAGAGKTAGKKKAGAK